jgi:hypothetical protein
VSGGCRVLCGHQLFHGFSSVSVSEIEEERGWNWTTGRGEIEGKGRNTLGISRSSTRPEWRSIDCP